MIPMVAADIPAAALTLTPPATEALVPGTAAEMEAEPEVVPAVKLAVATP
jgi:hypothetical protein